MWKVYVDGKNILDAKGVMDDNYHLDEEQLEMKTTREPL